MKRSALPQRTTRLRSKGGSCFPKRRCPEYMDHLHERLTNQEWPVLCDCGCGRLATDRAHLIPTGRGGNDLDNVALLNWRCHSIGPKNQEKRTDAFNEERGCDLWAKAREHTARWEQERDAA